MENREFSKVLEDRTRRFAVSVIKLSASLQNTAEGKVIRNQLTKSGTSIGANYSEANRSRSRADFSNKVKICESEAGETAYWLEIVRELNWVEDTGSAEIIKETNELLAIFTSIGKTLRQK